MLMSSSILTILDLKNVKNVTLKYAKIFSSVLSGVGGSADDCLGLVDLLMTGVGGSADDWGWWIC